MRIFILRSRPRPSGAAPKDPYTQEFGSSYAERVIGNLKGDPAFCASCGPDCNACRKVYGRKFGRNIAGVASLPAALPYLLEKPWELLPREFPPHEILLAVNIHEQVLLEALKRCASRGVVVPMEAPDWVSASARAAAKAICGEKGVEISFPRPFCSFDPPPGSVLAEFRERFHIGKPKVELTVRSGKIEKAYVHVSAPCGATYYVARWLEGKRVDDDLKHEVISKRMHSYPCTASMKWDDEIGDTILHKANQIHFEILSPLQSRAPEEPGLVMSPLGRKVLKLATPGENIRNIERAKEAILEDIAADGAASLQKLRKKRKIPPAAIQSALLILKQEGKIRMEGRKIVKT